MPQTHIYILAYSRGLFTWLEQASWADCHMNNLVNLQIIRYGKKEAFIELKESD